MRRSIPILLSTALVLGFAAPAGAQAPRTSNAFQFRFGGYFPSGDGEFWEGNEEVFTLSVSDFDDVTFGFGFVTSLTNNLELGFNIDFYDATVLSSYQDVYGGPPDNPNLPIYHDTHLETMPMTVDLRILPTGRYGVRGSGGQRQVVHPVPYFGGGIGFNYWTYEEVGDFVDFSDPDNLVILNGLRFVEDGTAFEAHVLAGLELPLGPSWSFLFEGRYSWCDDTPSGDFAGLGDLDLGGFYGMVGFSFRF